MNILNEKFLNGKPDKLTIAVTGLETSILTDVNEESPAVLQILNMGREHYARDLPYPSTFWLPGYAITKIASVAPDFWSWRGGGVDKLVSSEEAVIQAINEAIRSDEPTDRNEALYQTILLERLIEGHPGSENGTDEKKSEYRKLLYRLGTAYHFLEKYPRAYQNCRRALEIGKLSVDFAQQGKELNALGLVCRAMGKLQKSLNYFTEYLALSEKRGDKEGQGVALGHIGLVYRDMLQNERAIEYLKRARRINKEIRNPSNESDNLGNLGAAYQDIGEFENAIKYHSEALKVSKEIKDWKREIKDLSNLGVAFNSQGKRKKAIDYFQQALELSRENNDCTSERDMLIKIATYFWEQKKLDETWNYYEMAVDTCQEMGDDRNRCDVLIYLAELSHEFNETKEEVALYEKALDLSRKLRDEEKKLHCLRKLIQLHHRQWEPDKAKNYIDEASKLLGHNLKLKKINVWLLKDDLYRQPKSLATGRKYYLCLNIGKPVIGYSPLRQTDFIYNLAVEGEVSNKQIKAFEKTSRVLGKEQEEIPQPTPETYDAEESGPQTIPPTNGTQPTNLTPDQSFEDNHEEPSDDEVKVSVRLSSGAFEFDKTKEQLSVSWEKDSETRFTITPRKSGTQSIAIEGDANGIPFDDFTIDVEVEEAVATKISEIPETVKFKEPMQQRKSYLFSWDNVPGNDSDKLIRFLKDDFDIGWAENATIRKSDNSMVINISKDENATEIMMDEKTQKATLKISDGRTRDLNVKTEDGKLNIYMMRDVFISYAREEEKDYVIPLAVALSDLNITLWIDIKELLAGNNLRKDIDKGIEESEYGIALLSENYFLKEYPLLELDTFVKKQKKIIPIRCGFIDPYFDDKKYSFLKDLLHIDWKEGIENVMEKIIKTIRPELLPEFVYSDIRLKNIPTPQNQLHAASIIKTYRGAGRMIEASQIALDYLSLYQNDPNILNLYFNSAKATNDKYIIEIAIIKISEYLKSNPNNISVRENFISYLTKVKTGNIYQQIIIDDTSEWLENHHNINIKKDYLDIVLKKGNHKQVSSAIKEGKKWLIEEDNIQIRCALFRLVRERGSPIEIEDMLKETVNWITSNMCNKDSKNLIVDYITYIKDNGNDNQRRNAIDICEEWSRKNPEDNFVLPAYLSLIFRLRDLQYIDRAFIFIQEWLSFPFKKQSTSINVREHYIKFIRLLGSQEQVEEVIKENRKWLKGIEKVESQQNVRAGLLNLINIRGTDTHVLEEIDITLEWLNINKNETYVRSNLLNLAEEKCREDSIKDTIFENYTRWLNENRNYEPGTEVRKRFIRYILEVGDCKQQRKVIEDNEKWINVHNDKKVKKVLDELIREYTKYC